MDVLTQWGCGCSRRLDSWWQKSSLCRRSGGQLPYQARSASKSGCRLSPAVVRATSGGPGRKLPASPASRSCGSRRKLSAEEVDGGGLELRKSRTPRTLSGTLHKISLSLSLSLSLSFLLKVPCISCFFMSVKLYRRQILKVANNTVSAVHT